MTEQDMEIQSLRRELADMSHLLELAKQDPKHMAMYDMHGSLCKNWNVCYYKSITNVQMIVLIGNGGMIMFPNMSIEVLEAVEEKFKDDEEVLADCLVYLAHLGDKIAQVSDVEYKAMDALQRMERCPHCGTKYEVMYYKEYHPEVDAYEDMADIFCPNCDVG